MLLIASPLGFAAHLKWLALICKIRSEATGMKEDKANMQMYLT